MLKRLLRTALLIPLLAGFAACTPGSDDPVSQKGAIVPRKPVAENTAVSVFVEISASGAWTVELEYPESGPSGWATMDPASGTGDLGNARLRFSQNTDEASRIVTMNLVAKGKTLASASLEQLGTSGEPQGGGGQSSAKAGWMELPATSDNDGLVLLIHDMRGQQYRGSSISGIRNYSCYWDASEHMSAWVAYPLNNALSGNGNFGYLWGYDPLIPQKGQPDFIQGSSDLSKGGSYGGIAFDGRYWNRGHQLPRRDRQISQEAVASTCYPTNMTPQDGTFNSGIWSNLESKVRNYASMSDTSYVVTGCIWKNSNTYSGNKTGYAVRVPDHYYKAILYYGPHSQAAATKRYMAVAFYLPHDPKISTAELKDYMITVNQLEEITGIDFFVNLPAAVGETMAEKIEGEVLSYFK